MKRDLLEELRSGKELPALQLLQLTVKLSIPAIMAQISSIIMEYIDASMVGHLGSGESASIGLMASSTWLFGGMCMAVSIGFTVQVAQLIGAGKDQEARNIVKQSLVIASCIGMILLLLGVFLHDKLPTWLGGETEIRTNASRYFLIYSLALPFLQLNSLASGMLQCSGNMRLPSILHILMCGMDVVFNAFLIFPARKVILFGHSCHMYGAGLGVSGAALGTALSEVVTVLLMLYFLLVKSSSLHFRMGEKLHFSGNQLLMAVKIAVPVGVEQIVMCGAQVVSTRIVAPLGMVAIAANSFSVTAESLCYMPGYGIGSAATTLIGQSIGAGRKDITRKLSWLITTFGMVVMASSGVLMYFLAPWMIGLLSPDPSIRALGTSVLRIEAFAEPFYAASIVASGVFRGAGDTFVPSLLNFFSMWAVRLPLAAVLSTRIGLHGVWIAMCIELCVRGILFLIRLHKKA